MKPLLFSSILICSVLTGCGPNDAAKNAVLKYLNDPDSAKFSDLKPGVSNGDVCGKVNAKNKMGGYVGNTPFYYQKLTDSATIVDAPDSQDFRSFWLSVQSKVSSESIADLMSRCRSASQWKEVCGTEAPTSVHGLCDTLLNSDGSTLYKALREQFER